MSAMAPSSVALHWAGKSISKCRSGSVCLRGISKYRPGIMSISKCTGDISRRALAFVYA